MNIIQSNHAIKKGYFLNTLFDEATFEISQLKELMSEIIELIRNNELSELERIKTAHSLFYITSRTYELIVAHFKENDLFIIRNWSDESSIYMNRLVFLVNQFFILDYNAIMEYIDECGGFGENEKL